MTSKLSTRGQVNDPCGDRPDDYSLENYAVKTTGDIESKAGDDLVHYITASSDSAKSNPKSMAMKQEKTLRADHKIKLFGCFVGLLATFLVVGIASNFVVMSLVVNSQVQTSVNENGELVGKNGVGALKTSQSLSPSPLTSFLPDSAFDDLRYFVAVSSTGARVKLTVDGYMRLPARQCLPPIVELLTPAGTIYIEGTTLEFSQDVAPIFLEAGLLTSPSNPTGSRRKLSFQALEGFFNTLQAYAEANTTTCMPDLPSTSHLSKRFRGFATTLQPCGQQCKDEEGFDRENLKGIEMRRGIPYIVSHEKATVDDVASAVTPDAQYVRRNSVTRYPRVVDVFEHRLDNGTHIAKWVAHKGKKYRCKTYTKEETVMYTGDASVELADLKVRYDGFAWLNTRKHHEEPALRYIIESDDLRQEYYASADAVNQPLALFTEYCGDGECRPGQFVEYYDMDYDITDEEVEEAMEWPDLSRCASKTENILGPSWPFEVAVGEGYVTHDETTADDILQGKVATDAWTNQTALELRRSMQDYKDDSVATPTAESVDPANDGLDPENRRALAKKPTKTKRKCTWKGGKQRCTGTNSTRVLDLSQPYCGVKMNLDRIPADFGLGIDASFQWQDENKWCKAPKWGTYKNIDINVQPNVGFPRCKYDLTRSWGRRGRDKGWSDRALNTCDIVTVSGGGTIWFGEANAGGQINVDFEVPCNNVLQGGAKLPGRLARFGCRIIGRYNKNLLWLTAKAMYKAKALIYDKKNWKEANGLFFVEGCAGAGISILDVEICVQVAKASNVEPAPWSTSSTSKDSDWYVGAYAKAIGNFPWPIDKQTWSFHLVPGLITKSMHLLVHGGNERAALSGTDAEAERHRNLIGRLAHIGGPSTFNSAGDCLSTSEQCEVPPILAMAPMPWW